MTINQLPELSSPDGTEKVPVSSSGADYHVLMQNLMPGGAAFETVTISGSSTKTLDLTNGTRGLVICLGNSAGTKAIFGLSAHGTTGATSGSVLLCAGSSSPSLSLGTSTANEVGIINASTADVRALIISIYGRIST